MLEAQDGIVGETDLVFGPYEVIGPEVTVPPTRAFHSSVPLRALVGCATVSITLRRV